MTDAPLTATQPPAESPLGIQQPLLPPVPLGQSMLQPKFFTPLGAQSLRVLDPAIFLAVPNLALPSEESSFQSPFFDAPDSSTPTQSTVPAIQTQPQPRSPKSAPSEINSPATAPFERIAEAPLIETSTVEDLAIAEPLIARSPLADLDTPIVEASINETPIAQTVAVETPIAEDLAIAEPLIARSPLAEPDAAISSALDANETSFNPTESAAIAQAFPIESLDLLESPSPLVSRFSTEAPTPTPAEPSIEPSISPVSALDSDPPRETANQYPEAPLERSPFSSDDEITPTSTQPTDSAAIQRTTNLADSTGSASPIAPISAENPITPAVTDLTRSDADLPESVQPESTSIDSIPTLPSESSPTVASPLSVDNSESIALTDLAIAQPMLDAPEAIARLTVDESIDPVVDVAQSVMQPASDIDGFPANQAEEPSLPAALAGERQTEVARLGDPEANVYISSTAKPISGETIQPSPLEPASENDPVAAIAAHPVENSISVDENIQPQTTDLVEEKLENGKLENPIEMSLEQSSVEPVIGSTSINPILNQTPIQPQIQATSSNTFSILQHQQEHPEENETSTDASNLFRRTEELEIESQPSLQNSFESAEETQNLQALDIESLAQPITLDTPVQRVQPETNTQIDSVSQSTIKPTIQLQAEAESIAAKTSATAIQTDALTQADTQSVPESLSTKWIDSSPAESAARSTHSPSDPSEALQIPSIQPISEISQPVQRKVVDKNIIPEAGATAEDESFIEAGQTSALPELPSVLQRLSVLEPIAQMQSIYTAPDTAPAPTVQPNPATRSSVIPEIQTQPFESLFEVPFEAPSIRRKSDIGTNDYSTQSAIASSPESLTPDSLTPNSLTPNSPTEDSPVPTEWGNIAELFNPSADFHSPLEPENTFPDDNYPDLLSSPHSTSTEMLQTSPALPVEAAAPVETETHGDREASAQAPDQSANSGSPEHLERLAQEVYQLIRQRLALERERGGKSGSGRLL